MSDLPQSGGRRRQPLSVIAMLTATGIAVGLVIVTAPGTPAGSSDRSLIGAPIATGALPDSAPR